MALGTLQKLQESTATGPRAGSKEYLKATISPGTRMLFCQTSVFQLLSSKRRHSFSLIVDNVHRQQSVSARSHSRVLPTSVMTVRSLRCYFLTSATAGKRRPHLRPSLTDPFIYSAGQTFTFRSQVQNAELQFPGEDIQVFNRSLDVPGESSGTWTRTCEI